MYSPLYRLVLFIYPSARTTALAEQQQIYLSFCFVFLGKMLLSWRIVYTKIWVVFVKWIGLNKKINSDRWQNRRSEEHVIEINEIIIYILDTGGAGAVTRPLRGLSIPAWWKPR